MSCENCPRLKKILNTQVIFLLITNVIIWSSQYKFSYDLHTDLVEIEKIIGQSLPTKGLEERIFHLIIGKYYKKNNTVTVNGTI